jgi:hypothetical protein
MDLVTQEQLRVLASHNSGIRVCSAYLQFVGGSFLRIGSIARLKRMIIFAISIAVIA